MGRNDSAANRKLVALLRAAQDVDLYSHTNKGYALKERDFFRQMMLKHYRDSIAESMGVSPLEAAIMQNFMGRLFFSVETVTSNAM